MAITFPSFKKHNGKAKMLSLLNEIQAFLLMGSEGETLSMYQQALIPKTKTFIQFGEEYQSMGLSEHGGLLKYCINAITIVNDGLNTGIPPMPIVTHIAEKMAHVVVAMDRIVSDEDLTHGDKVLLQEAKELANNWLCNDKRAVLVSKINQIVEDLNESLASQGKLETLKKGEANFAPLMTWNWCHGQPNF